MECQMDMPDRMSDGMNWMPWWGSLEAKYFFCFLFIRFSGESTFAVCQSLGFFGFVGMILSTRQYSILFDMWQSERMFPPLGQNHLSAVNSFLLRWWSFRYGSKWFKIKKQLTCALLKFGPEPVGIITWVCLRMRVYEFEYGMVWLQVCNLVCFMDNLRIWYWIDIIVV